MAGGVGMATILVVEDNKDVSFMICETLRSYIGCRVVAAMDGKRVWRWPKKRRRT